MGTTPLPHTTSHTSQPSQDYPIPPIVSLIASRIFEDICNNKALLGIALAAFSCLATSFLTLGGELILAFTFPVGAIVASAASLALVGLGLLLGGLAIYMFKREFSTF